MKITYAGAISTAAVILLGMVLIIPAFSPPSPPDNYRQRVLLVFSVADEGDASEWLLDLSFTLNKHQVPATVFVSGKLASSHPECIVAFADNVDIGSRTYSYVELPAIPDYLIQLEEVENGKNAVDTAGNLNSKLFMAPFRETDDEIYSLLSRSGIIADFSYTDHYNKFHNGQFIRFEIESYDGSEYSADFFLHIETEEPIMILFESDTPVTRIDDFIAILKSGKTHFINASEITGLNLTLRE